jgi:hypothetical protein
MIKIVSHTTQAAHIRFDDTILVFPRKAFT